MAIPPPSNPGDPILAAAWNALREAVARLRNGRAAPGLRGLAGALGLEDGRPEPLYRGRIVARVVDGADPDGAGVYASAVKSYTVRMIGRGASVEAVIPPSRMVGRPNTRDTVAVYPARVGHKCLLFRAADVEGVVSLWMVVLTEEIKFVKKCKEPGGKPGGGGDGVTPTVDVPGGPEDPGNPGRGFSTGAPGASGSSGSGGAGAGGAAGH